MSDPVSAELELRRHFEGQRAGRRIAVSLPVEVICLQRNLSARTVNLSVSGALLHILDAEERGMAELIAYCAEINELFAAGGTVSFACGVTRTMEAVRVTAGGLGGRSVPMLACRFKGRLTTPDFERMGLPAPSADDLTDDVDAEPGAARVDPAPAGAPQPREVPAVQELLRWAVDMEATDIHIKAGSPPRLRVGGVLSPVGSACLTDADARAMVRNFISDQQWEEFERTGDLDAGFALEGVARFRINVMRTRRSICAVLRRIPLSVPSLEELELSPVCAKLAKKKRGLVLVTGGSGSGKSTTLAAMLHEVNAKRPCHIVTLEDPIEYVHEEIEAQITQREIGPDTETFSAALKRVLRQDPDVIMIGEMRDLETIKLAVTAAETGHLVFATLHTTSAAQTVDRIVDVFPAEQQRQIRVQLASTLHGILCQTLVPKLDGGVTVAQEVLVMTDAVRALIREAKSQQLLNAMQMGANDGMQTLEKALNELVRQEVVSYETALDYANVPSLVLDPHGGAGSSRAIDNVDEAGVEDERAAQPSENERKPRFGPNYRRPPRRGG